MIYVGSYIGGASKARLAFIFNGGSANNNNPNGDGYYYWMLDDISLILPGTLSLAEDINITHFQPGPNLAQNEHFLLSKAQKKLQAELYDMGEKFIKNFSISTRENKPDISELRPGIYQLCIEGVSGSLALGKN